MSAVALFTGLWQTYPPQLSVQAALLVVAVLISENFSFSIEPYSVSLAFPLGVASALLCGPTVSCLVAAVSATSYGEVRQGKPFSVVSFNLAQLVLSTGLAAAAYVRLGGRVLGSSPLGSRALEAADFPRVLLPLVAMAAIAVLGNMLITAVGVSLLTRRRLADLARTMTPFVPAQLALAFVGFLVAQVLAISILALPLFIAPLAVARQLYMRYAGMKEAYVDTVRSLIGALEAKDPYTRGHSERVSVYSAELGALMALDARALERLEYAALLHDLGKLAVSGSVLSKPGRLEPAEMDQIREHPSKGAQMIGRIPPLRDLAETISQHHERLDGTGYPAGICSSDICLGAKILAVADSYDAMTTTRAYRPALTREQAVGELLDGRGSQFDHEVVRVFVDNGVALQPVSSDACESDGSRAIESKGDQT